MKEGMLYLSKFELTAFDPKPPKNTNCLMAEKYSKAVTLIEK